MKGYSGYILCYNDLYTIEMAVVCLSNYVDDVLVIDCGSCDGSWELLMQLKEKLGIKLMRIEQGTGRYKGWKTQPAVRNLALQTVDNDWVITLDADECFTDDFKPFKPSCGIGMIKRYNLISPTHYIEECREKDGRIINSWFPDYQARVLDRRLFGYPQNMFEHCRPMETATMKDCMLCGPSEMRGAILHYRNLSRGISEIRMRSLENHIYLCKPLPCKHSQFVTHSKLPMAIADACDEQNVAVS